jgi:hypothetical protein
MRIKKGFKLRTVGSEYIVAGESLQQIDFNKLISFNATAAYLWKEVENKEFDTQSLADLLIKEYQIDADTAFADAADIVDKWIKVGMVEE